LRLDFWTSFLSFTPNLSFSYLDDFVADVGKRAGNCVGKLAENWVDLMKIGLMSLSSILMWKLLS